MAFEPASQLGVALFEDTDPVQLRPGRWDEEGTTKLRDRERTAFCSRIPAQTRRNQRPRVCAPSGKIRALPLAIF